MASKLKIFACTLNDDGIPTAVQSEFFEAMINPDQYTIDSSIKYTLGKGLGKGGEEWKFTSVPAETITLGSIVLDGTGAVEGATKDSVTDRIAKLKKLAMSYDGSAHQTPVLQLSWGGLVKFLRLKSMKAEYTLFKSDGEPLRAKVTLTFGEYKSAKTIAAASKITSPDLTHLVEVKAGDTLPLLCQRIYKNPGHHLEVARINNLSSPRILAAGMVLTFPPLRD